MKHNMQQMKMKSNVNLVILQLCNVMTFSCIILSLICFTCILSSPVRSGHSSIHSKNSECPSNDHLLTLALTATSRSSQVHSNRNIDNSHSNNINCFCSSDSHSSEGWEITCIENTPSVMRDKVNSFKPSRVNESNDTSVNNSKGKSSSSSSSPPPLYTLQTSPLAFTIKNDNGRAVEISCDSAVPDFKPAMLQGKHISLHLSLSLSLHH